MTARATLSESSRVALGPAPRDAASSRRARRSVRSLAEKKERKRAARRFAKERAKKRAKYAAKRARKIELHGVDKVRADGNRWRREWYERHRGDRPRKVTMKALAAATRDALVAAKGNQKAAARALKISKVALWNRLNECTIEIDGAAHTLRAWLDRRWPQRAGHRATAATIGDPEHGTIGSYTGPIRVYVLAAHGDVLEGAHRNRVPAVGKVRGRVVCQVCREESEA